MKSLFCAEFWDCRDLNDNTFTIFITNRAPDFFLFPNFIFSYVYIVTYGSSPSAIYTIIVIIIKFSHIKRVNTALQSSLSQKKKWCQFLFFIMIPSLSYSSLVWKCDHNINLSFPPCQLTIEQSTCYQMISDVIFFGSSSYSHPHLPAYLALLSSNCVFGARTWLSTSL